MAKVTNDWRLFLLSTEIFDAKNIYSLQVQVLYNLSYYFTVQIWQVIISSLNIFNL